MLTKLLRRAAAEDFQVTADQKCSFCRQPKLALVEGPSGIVTGASLICRPCAERAAAMLRHTAAVRHTRQRWWRFSLRTLLVGMTVLALWLGWNANVVLQRKAVRLWIAQVGGRAGVDGQSVQYSGETYYPLLWRGSHERRWRVPPWRRLMGDESIDVVVLPPGLEPDQYRKVRELLPEVRMINLLVSQPAEPESRSAAGT